MSISDQDHECGECQGHRHDRRHDSGPAEGVAFQAHDDQGKAGDQVDALAFVEELQRRLDPGRGRGVGHESLESFEAPIIEANLRPLAAHVHRSLAGHARDYDGVNAASGTQRPWS